MTRQIQSPGTRSVLNFPDASVKFATQGLAVFDAFLKRIVAEATGVPSLSVIVPEKSRVLPPSITVDSEITFLVSAWLLVLRDLGEFCVFSFTAIEPLDPESRVKTRQRQRNLAIETLWLLPLGLPIPKV